MRVMRWPASILSLCLLSPGSVRADEPSGPAQADPQPAQAAASAPEADPELRYTGGWMFAVGLPASIIGGVAALEASEGGPLAQRQLAPATRVVGTTVFALGTAAWTVGLALWVIGRQPVSVLPSLSVGPTSALVGVGGTTSLFGGS